MINNLRAIALIFGIIIATPANADCDTERYARLAIIIDDLGYNLQRGEAVVALPAPVTLAIIPATPHARTLAKLGLDRGKETLIHMPMTSAHTTVGDPLALSAELSPEQFQATIDDAIASVPGAVGMNNHMGSALTRDHDAMAALMSQLKKHHMIFIDSRTTTESVALEEASAGDVPSAARSVFLDNERDHRLIRENLSRAIRAAQISGSAIAIGHPYPETLEVLTDALPRLPNNVILTRVSQLAECKGS